MKTFLLLSFLLFFSQVSLFATEKVTVAGTIYDVYKKPLIHANIFNSQTLEGTISDSLGNFSFSTSTTSEIQLVCSFMGYKKFCAVYDFQHPDLQNLKIILKPQTIEHSDVIVSASAFTASEEEGVTLTDMDVVNTPGAAADIFWAVKSLPGTAQVDEGAGLFVRGGDVSETMMLLDGLVISHPYKYESPTGGYFGTFSPFLLKGTFFSSGGFSVRYGNALSSVLQMESLDLPSSSNYSLGLGLAAKAAQLEIPLIDNKLGVNLSANMSTTGYMFLFNQSDRDFLSYPEANDLNINLIYKINAENSLKLFMFTETDKVGIRVEDPDFEQYFQGDTKNQFVNLQSKNYYKGCLVQSNFGMSRFENDIRLGQMSLNTNDRLLQFHTHLEKKMSKQLILRTGLNHFSCRISYS